MRSGRCVPENGEALRLVPDLSFSMPNKKDSMVVSRKILAAGKLTPVIDRMYPLGEVPEARRYLEEGHA